MPLLDHFHPPLEGRRHWESFHGQWAAVISENLNQTLPEQYFAEIHVKRRMRIEVEVGTFSEGGVRDVAEPVNGTATAVLTRVWAPPTPTVVVPASFPDDIEVQVYSTVAGPILVAAIELVSPANKDRDETRLAFAAKCSAYLQRGIGLIVVDIVTKRHANLHDELAALLGQGDSMAFPEATPLYATAYRPMHRQERNEIDVWREPLGIGKGLPTLPLAIRGLGCLPIDLEATYTEACARGRIG